MSKQYDAIGALYNNMTQLPAARLEKVNVHAAVRPFVENAKALDLACGTGYYSLALLEWGAHYVIGVDISENMIQAARANLERSDPKHAEKCLFVIADVSRPMELGAGPFDLVLGAWLLNYASCAEEMTSMWRTISSQLRDGGHFIGITPYPAANREEMIQNSRACEDAKYGVSVLIQDEIPNGHKTHVIAHVDPTKVEFDNYVLSH